MGIREGARKGKGDGGREGGKERREVLSLFLLFY
jgi:hypothetical protein